MGFAQELYFRFAPRWFKVIRWREFGARFYEKEVMSMRYIYAPVLMAYLCPHNKVVQQIALKRPQTEEELLQIRQEYLPNTNYRNCEIDQYETDIAPKYDMAVRRKKYPEYYGTRYDGFKRYYV